MQPLNRVHGRAIPLGLKNVDTDIIIPAKWLKTVSREGLGAGAFEALRNRAMSSTIRPTRARRS
jgi:3-isopropylmalate/(R)-2-methylmalate dehydratase small subunit